MEGRGSGFLREFLDRFRRSAGVPAQVTDELAVELVPLFEALDALDRDAAILREDAARQAAERRESVTAEVEGVLAAARDRAEHERLRVEADARRAVEIDADAIRASGAVEAGRIRAQASARIPVLVERVVRCVLQGDA